MDFPPFPSSTATSLSFRYAVRRENQQAFGVLEPCSMMPQCTSNRWRISRPNATPPQLSSVRHHTNRHTATHRYSRENLRCCTLEYFTINFWRRDEEVGDEDGLGLGSADGGGLAGWNLGEEDDGGSGKGKARRVYEYTGWVVEVAAKCADAIIVPPQPTLRLHHALDGGTIVYLAASPLSSPQLSPCIPSGEGAEDSLLISYLYHNPSPPVKATTTPPPDIHFLVCPHTATCLYSPYSPPTPRTLKQPLRIAPSRPAATPRHALPRSRLAHALPRPVAPAHHTPPRPDSTRT
ncbi:hypothetical protein E2C01_002420 [Portunus trituberculatus]|uniref:Uncharacterized protein n=1 Tax=Portunus trituberculatus TaxID=210409 RepID=A0A5B7CLW4_PORTR|nr:hypothetical protein [Portunus trituberculatus]